MPLTREQISARIESIARRICRTPRLVNINTIAFRRATNLCGTSWEPGAASTRQRALRPRRPLGRGYLVRTIARKGTQ